MLEKLKMALRITHSELDGEIEDLKTAALLDLKRVGVEKRDEEDALIVQAVKMYVKAELDFDGKGERYRRAYEMMAQALSLCGEYHV